jgi:hypothetical protein
LPLPFCAAQSPRDPGYSLPKASRCSSPVRAALGDAKGDLSVAGGTSPQNIEVMKTFLRRCPAVLVTGNREKADFVVRLDHQEPNPTTLFVRGNKVAVFNRNDDLIYSTSTRTLATAVKSACEAITTDSRK